MPHVWVAYLESVNWKKLSCVFPPASLRQTHILHIFSVVFQWLGLVSFSSFCPFQSLSACLHPCTYLTALKALRPPSFFHLIFTFKVLLVSLSTLLPSSMMGKGRRRFFFYLLLSHTFVTKEKEKKCNFTCPFLFHTVLSSCKGSREGMRPRWLWINMFCLQYLQLFFFFLKNIHVVFQWKVWHFVAVIIIF